MVVWKEVGLGRLNERNRQEVENEIEILSLLDHPNVIAYSNHFFCEDMLYIEMEYANGTNAIRSDKQILITSYHLYVPYQEAVYITKSRIRKDKDSSQKNWCFGISIKFCKE